MGIISKIKLPNSSVPYEISANWLNITNKPDFRNIDVEVEGTVLNIDEDTTINTSETSTSTTGVNDELKMALLQLAANVSYINGNGESIYNTLQKALYDTISLSSITAYYDDSKVIYNNDNIEKLR